MNVDIILLVIHILISIVLVLIILAQTSKGNGLDSNLGGAAANVFGSSASDMLKKWTQIVGGLFLVSCVVLAINVKSGTGIESATSGILPDTNPNTKAKEVNIEESENQDASNTDEVTPEATSETTTEVETESDEK